MVVEVPAHVRGGLPHALLAAPVHLLLSALQHSVAILLGKVRSVVAHNALRKSLLRKSLLRQNSL